MASDRTSRQAELVEAMTAIVLQDGLEALALRGLAARLSTSGRMLLYYPATAPFMRIWSDVIVRAARGETPYREVAGERIGAWLDWIASRLHPSADNHAAAVSVLSIMEGLTLVEMARPGTTMPARQLLAELLDRRLG